MKFNLRLISIIILGFVISGCAEQYKVKVVCDSGFETPPSNIAYVDDGNIIWRVEKRGYVTERKMLSGEICRKIRVSK